MKQVIRFLALTLVLACSSVTQAAVVTFDDFPYGGDLEFDFETGKPKTGSLYHNGHFDDATAIGYIQDGYQGLNWDNTKILQSRKSPYLEGSGYPNAAASGRVVAYGRRMNVSSGDGGLFDFNGAYLTGMWRDGLAIEITGFVNNVLTYTETVIVDTTSATWFDFDFLGIDSLTFQSLGGGVLVPGHYRGIKFFDGSTAFAMDNFTFTKVSDVPLPAAVWLFGAGFCMFAGLRRRKQKMLSK